MNELIEHVERLLTEHDCVVVPGLGGFVLNEVPVRISDNRDVFQPRGKEISFNVRLTFNDGILVQSFQETYALSFEEAVERVKDQVRAIHDQLDQGRYMGFGRIGTLLKNEQGQLVFRPDNRNLFCPECYGLTSFAYSTLESRLKAIQADHRKDEFIHLRLRRKVIQNIMTGVAACLLMLLISRPAGELRDAESQQAFLLKNCLVSTPEMMKADFNQLSKPVIKNTVPDSAINVVSESTAILPNTPASLRSMPTPKQGTVLTTAIKTTRLRKRPTPTTDDIDALFGIKSVDTQSTISAPVKPTKVVLTTMTKRPVLSPARKALQAAPGTTVSDQQASGDYYIVVSSHPSKDVAQAWLDSNRRGVYQHASIVEGDGRARICINHFQNKRQAEHFLNQFRNSHPEHADAWLLCGKN
ncbi:MAG: hypothetical protein Q8914_10745 [Bacteroidota bacterium]|nr:hypothetical protein [Bacteroidota bacterium]